MVVIGYGQWGVGIGVWAGGVESEVWSEHVFSGCGHWVWAVGCDQWLWSAGRSVGSGKWMWSIGVVVSWWGHCVVGHFSSVAVVSGVVIGCGQWRWLVVCGP